MMTAPSVEPPAVGVSSSGNSASKFSSPPPADVSTTSSTGKYRDYDNTDFSKFTSSIRESDGIDDDAYLERQRRYRTAAASDSYLTSFYNGLPPRARHCVNAISMGARMGAAVGGCFGFLTGAYYSVVQRNVLLLPVGVLGGAASFGFFLGCGMIIRCDDGKVHYVVGRRGHLADRSSRIAAAQRTGLVSSAPLSMRPTPRPRTLMLPFSWRSKSGLLSDDLA
ncbi:unnamed protein product [Amoebophrya sp. A25]|nr:unnamed protein product [Amoebophrya sp. A25]|eukprot:GSA25T00012050001.1